MTSHYSGNGSREFWNRVNRLASPDADVLYMLGVVLQDLESRVLNQLRNAELKAKSTRKRGRTGDD